MSDIKSQAILPLLHSGGGSRIIVVQGSNYIDISKEIDTLTSLISTEDLEYEIINNPFRCNTRQRIIVVVKNYEINIEECNAIVPSYCSCGKNQWGIIIVGVFSRDVTNLPRHFKTALVLSVPNNSKNEILINNSVSKSIFEGHPSLASRIELILKNISTKTEQKNSLMRMAVPTGMLFMGPSGCGKTLLGRHVLQRAREGFGMHTESIVATELFGKYLGETESRLRELFERMREATSSQIPSVLFIDEIDAIGARRSDAGNSSDAGTSSVRALSALLCELDGIIENSNLLILAATSLPWNLDPALLRQGRFETIINIPLPTLSERTRIIESSLGHIISSDISLDSLANSTENFTPAALKWIIKTAGQLAFIDPLKPSSIQQTHINLALNQARKKQISKRVIERYLKCEMGG